MLYLKKNICRFWNKETRWKPITQIPMVSLFFFIIYSCFLKSGWRLGCNREAENIHSYKKKKKKK